MCAHLISRNCRHRLRKVSAAVAILVGVFAGTVWSKPAADSNAYSIAFAKTLKPELDSSAVYAIDTLTIEHRDFALHMDSGTLYLLKPAIVDSQSLVYGAFYVGSATFRFSPPLQMERDQIRRFLKSDTLNRLCDAALLLFNRSIYDRIVAGRQTIASPPNKKTGLKFKSYFDDLTIREDYEVPFAAFKNLIAPRSKPFLAALISADATGDLVYTYDPYQREEVSLYKKYREMLVDVALEKLCQYSVYADSTFERLNGIDKDEVRILHYDLDGSINGGGRYTGSAKTHLLGEISGTRLLSMGLHEELWLDSVFDQSGSRVPFVRWTKERHKGVPVYLFLNTPIAKGDTATLTFYYHGDIAESKMGVFLVTAGSSWFPYYSWRDNATFSMTFNTPPQYAFVATGTMVDSQQIDGQMRTKWRLDTPTAFATFNLGTLTRYPFEIRTSDSLFIYFNEHHHQLMAQQNVYQRTSLEQDEDTVDAVADFREETVDPSRFAEGLGVAGAHMEQQVAGDIRASLNLYRDLFGPVPDNRLVATDLTQLVSRSHPQFLTLSYATFFKSDQFGTEQLHRSHVAAYQWWGEGVRSESYHDAWLSVGFAEYSSLLYLQRAAGNDRLLYWLDRYRDNIASLNKFIFKTRQQAGPIILGYRTSTTQSPNDYDLIIYEKGAYVLHMLRGLMLDLNTYSDSAFYAMLRDYFEIFYGRFANTRDFKAVVEKHVGGDMTWFFDQWVYGNAVPEYAFSYKVTPDSVGRYVAHCTVDQTGVPPEFKMPVPIEIKFRAGGSAWIRQWIDKAHCEFDIPIEGEPSELVFNPMHFVLCNFK